MPDLSEEAIQAAVEAVLAKQWRDAPSWAAHARHGFDSGCAVCQGDVPAIVKEALQGLAGAGMVVVSAELLDSLSDSDECWFDHHGGCQAHGYLSLEPGERCPQAEVRELLAALPERNADA
jgi:hypothetical protein